MASISAAERALRSEGPGPVRIDRARCVLLYDRRILLAQHKSRRLANRSKWGLPGGRVDEAETPKRCLRRELLEELDLRVPYLIELGDWVHRDENHRVFGCEIDRKVVSFDTDELLAIRWFSLPELRDLARAQRLRFGFELAAVKAFRRLLPDRERAS